MDNKKYQNKEVRLKITCHITLSYSLFEVHRFLVSRSWTETPSHSSPTLIFWRHYQKMIATEERKGATKEGRGGERD